MSKLFNIVQNGIFTDNLTFSRPMSTPGSVLDTGVNGIPVTVVMPANVITSEAAPIKGIFLQVSAVDRNAAGTFDISLSTPVATHTYTYYVSSLYKEANKGQDFPLSQYWQGFDLLDIDMSGSPTFELEFSCTSHGELKLIGSSSTSRVNRYFVVSDADYLSATPMPEIRIGSYLKPIRVTSPTGTINASGDLPNTTIVCDISSIETTNVVVWNKSTLHINSAASVINRGPAGILAAPGSTIIASPSSSIGLINCSLVGLANSTITLSGTEKLPYTHLASDVAAGAVSFDTVDSIADWNTRDVVMYTGNTASGTTETNSINLKTSNTSYNSLFSVFQDHASINTVPLNIYGEFYGAPVLNLTRDMVVTMNTPASIKAEDSCTLNLHNIQITSAGLAGTPLFLGLISLYNSNSRISKCTIAGSPRAGVYIDTSKASNFDIINNNIVNNSIGISQEKRPTIINELNTSCVSGNAIVSNSVGIATNYLNTVEYTDNIVSHNNGVGMSINFPGVLSVLPVCVSKKINNNVFFTNAGNGLVIGNVTGSSINNINSLNNNLNGVLYAPTSSGIAVNSIKCAFNKAAGIVFQGTSTGSELSAYNVDCQFNQDKGAVLVNVHGAVSGINILSNLNESLTITNCNNGILNISDVNIENNEKSVKYSYPNLNGFNFFPTYINNGRIMSGTLESTCITLINTKCEKFVVNAIEFNSTGPNITLEPAANTFIEGSYIFSNCTFSLIPFDDISSKYQTDIFSETGFATMYINGEPAGHRKHTPAGTVEADTITFKNTNYKVSEKLTPSSSTLKLKSSKKVIFIDNFTGTAPSSLTPEYLYASVWVKKDGVWGTNADPRLMVASNPVLKINSDTIIDTHTLNTTDWVQLTSITPIASAVDARGAIELYVDCSGTSGGSINVDQWNYTIIRGN